MQMQNGQSRTTSAYLSGRSICALHLHFALTLAPMRVGDYDDNEK